MGESNIEWTDVTDNIIVAEDGGWFCLKCSEGCDNCYSEAINQNKFFGGNGRPFSGAVPKLVFKDSIMNGWHCQRKPKKHFVSSMTDIFGQWVPESFSMRMLDRMASAPKQTFQLLTKRAHIMEQRTNQWADCRVPGVLPKNIWLGTSVENQKWGDIRIPKLLQTRASVKFLSCEPLLGPLDIRKYLPTRCAVGGAVGTDMACGDCDPCIGGRKASESISWCIVGGESGPNRRPMNIKWARSLRDQCKETGVAFFMKQIDKVQPIPEDLMIRQFPNNL